MCSPGGRADARHPWSRRDVDVAYYRTYGGSWMANVGTRIARGRATGGTTWHTEIASRRGNLISFDLLRIKIKNTSDFDFRYFNSKIDTVMKGLASNCACAAAGLLYHLSFSEWVEQVQAARALGHWPRSFVDRCVLLTSDAIAQHWCMPRLSRCSGQQWK